MLRPTPTPVDSLMRVEKNVPNRSRGTRSRIQEFQLQFETAPKAEWINMAIPRTTNPASGENKKGMKAVMSQDIRPMVDAKELIALLHR